MVSTKLVELTAQQLASQRKKIEKDRRRKIFEDLQVQGTNSSSIVSKRSVEMLYTTKLEPETGEWFKYFVKKGKRRSPAINRGYWIRMESIKQMILRIIDKNSSIKRIQIVNLGCGFDPLPFQLLHCHNEHSKLEFIDIDYPDLVENKYNMILESPEILNVIGNKNDQVAEDLAKLGVKLSTDSYKLVGCDLKDQSKYESMLSNVLSKDSVKIFIAEVSLAYMEPQYANPIIEISSKFNQVHFLILEQNLPGGRYNAFAQKMIYHFDHLRHPLKCVETYPLVEDQVARFKAWFPQVEIANLFENWRCLVDEDTKSKVYEIEEFDEWEEFILFCQHYTICHAANILGDQTIYPKSPEVKDTDLQADENFIISVDEVLTSKQIQLKYPAVTSTEESIIIQGGLEQTRSDEMIEFTGEEKKVTNGPVKRMAHTLTTMKDNSVVLIGGRTRPGEEFKDIYHYTQGKWELIDELPYGVSRHGCVALNDDEILLFSNKSFRLVNIREKTNYDIEVVGDSIPGLQSFGMDYDINTGVGYIVGGMIEVINPQVNDKLFKFTYQDRKLTVQLVGANSQFCRIGCHLHIKGDNLIILGGISPLQVFARDDVICYNTTTASITTIALDEEISRKFPPMLIGFGSCKFKQGITVVGGGAVCYSFGSVYNHAYTIRHKET